jgi:hypothetical protein
MAFAYNPGPMVTNDYSRNPIPPGYGISNYFELMPDKINPVIYKRQHGLRKEAISLKVIKHSVQINLPELCMPGNLELSIYAISGKLVHRYVLTQNIRSGLYVNISLPRLAPAVYILSVRYNNEFAINKILIEP